MAYEKELNDIQSKYNYDEEMMSIIKCIYRGFMIYYNCYGNYSNKIYDTFMNTRIIPYNVSINSFGEKINLMRQYSDKSEEDINDHLISEGGELLSKLDGNKVINTAIIRRTEGKINIPTVIHELVHSLVSSKEVIKEDYKRYIQSGISKRYIEPVEFVYNHSIEEGFTEYDTMMICLFSKIDYVESYSVPLDYVRYIMNDNNINNIITKSRLDGINYIDQLDNEIYKDSLSRYIRNFESIYTNKNINEMVKLIELNKEEVSKIMIQKSR